MPWSDYGMDSRQKDCQINSLVHSMIMDHTLGDSTADSGTLKLNSTCSDINNNSVWSAPDHFNSPNPLQTIFGLQSLGTGLTPTPTNDNLNGNKSPNMSIHTPKMNLETATFRAIRSAQHSTGKKSNSSMGSSEPMDSSGISSGTDLSDSIFGDVVMQSLNQQHQKAVAAAAVSSASSRMDHQSQKSHFKSDFQSGHVTTHAVSSADRNLQNAAMMASFLNPSLNSFTQPPPVQQPTASTANNNYSAASSELIRVLWMEEMKRQQQETQQLLYSAEVLKLLNCGSGSSNPYSYLWPPSLYPGLTGTSSGSTSTSQPTQSLPSASSTYQDEVNSMAALYRNVMTASDDEIEKAANFYRNSASLCDANHHWSGKLPVRVYKNAMFSRKVFLGGVPWDVNDMDLQQGFTRFGSLQVMWPSRESCSVQSRSSPRGYCYLIFDQEMSVRNMLKQCTRDVISLGEYYYKISSCKMKSKEVQVIPWCINDSQFTKQGSHRLDAKRTVFIGALHGMITAEALATIINDLFGNVAFAALDTDKYKYPIGSGRVAFTSQRSYMKAVQANFVEIRTTKFTKTIQIDPYLEDSMCNHCFISPGIYFCRAFECFRYFCPSCWNLWHGNSDHGYTHKPLRRTFKTNFQNERK